MQACGTRAGRFHGAMALMAMVLGAAPPLAAQSPAAGATTMPSSSVAPQKQSTSGDDALDNAVAAVLVAALSEQLAAQTVEVHVDSFNVGIASARERSVAGQGRLRLGDAPDWIGFRYATRYDTTFATAAYPQISIGGVSAGEREVPNDSSLIRQLEERVSGELDAQFGARAARLQLDSIRTVEGGQRLLRISAEGIADFGLNGTTPVRIEGVYDRVVETWPRVNYELGLQR